MTSVLDTLSIRATAAPIPQSAASARLKICFLCGSLQPGRDGVGDYARRLAGEWFRQMQPASLIALNDSSVKAITLEKQEDEDVLLPVLRLPATMSWSDRMAHARAWLGQVRPDWLSLQFVPFAFHPKGLCFGLGEQLATLGNPAAWHVMFHELWLGLGTGAPMKDRVWGWLQRRAVRDLMRQLRPAVAHTQAEPYRTVLAREKISAGHLPLFSNIPRATGDGWEDIIGPALVRATRRIARRNDFYLMGVLGSVHPEWNARQAVDVVSPLASRAGKKPVLAFVGRSNLSPKAFSVLQESVRDRAIVLDLGEQTSLALSKILNALDLGLATSPQQIIEKSGSVAAMREHGLPVLATRNDWQLRWPVATSAQSVLTPKTFAPLGVLPGREAVPSASNGVRETARRMMGDLNRRMA